MSFLIKKDKENCIFDRQYYEEPRQLEISKHVL